MTKILNRAMTLVELSLSIAILGLLILGITSFTTYCKTQVFDTRKRAFVQNELNNALEYISRDVVNAQHNGIPDAGDVGGIQAFFTFALVDVDIAGGDYLGGGRSLWINTDTAAIGYHLAFGRLERSSNASHGAPGSPNGWFYTTEPVVVEFDADVLDDDVSAVNIRLVGRYNYKEPASPNNPEVVLETVIRSRSAAAFPTPS